MAFSKKSDEPTDLPADQTKDRTLLDFDGQGEVTTPERILRWFLLFVAIVLISWLLYVVSAAFVPRWWAQYVGNRVDGSFSAGVAWGFGFGFVATLFSLLILLQVGRPFLAWWGKLTVVILAVLVSVPNLMTLAVSLGTGKAARAGRRIFDVNAPAFQWSTVVGVVTAAILVLLLVVVVWRSRRNRRQLEELKNATDAAKESNPPKK